MTLRAFITCLLFLESRFHHWLFIAPKKTILLFVNIQIIKIGNIKLTMLSLYRVLLKTLLHKTNEILFNMGKEMLEIETEKLYIVLK